MDSEKKKVNQRGRRAVPAQYRRKRPVKKLIIGASIALCVVLAVVIGLLFWMNRGTEDPEQGTPPPDKVIHLVAGGNVNVTDETIEAGFRNGTYDYTEVFKDVLPVLASGDITVLNFEGVLSGTNYGTETKAAPAELMTALKNAGVDVIQTANSYSVFDGLRGLNSTLQGVRNAGMTPLGTYASTSDFEQSGGYIIWEVKGIKVAMMAFTKGMVEGMGLPSENCVNLLYEDYKSTYQNVDEEGITKIVRNAAAHDPDVMIALVHWGSEAADQISKSQTKICTLLQEEGVDAIIGTHPHYVHKMEFDSETGAFVAYSLGDFYGSVGTAYSVLLDLQITQDGATGETKVTGFDYVPIYLEENEDGTMRVLRMEEAVLGYENRYLDRVSEETYNAMKSALEKIKSRVGVK